MDQSRAPAYRLVRRPLAGGQTGAGAAGGPPRLDQAQQQVVDHAGGPLLVLAGPGTGKTTTIVAAVADRIENRGIAPERILVLTFSRKAAAELRERITARLRRTTREPLAVTFHSYAYALARREFVLAGDEPPRLLSAPEQLLEVRRMLKGEAQDGGARWPERLRPALATRGFAEEVRDLLLRAAERGLDGRGLRQLGKHKDRDDWMAAAGFLDRYAARFDLAPVPAYDYAEIVRIAAALLGREETRQRERGAYDVVLVDEYQDSDPAQESLLMALAGDGRELIAVGDPDQSIYAFRGADVRALIEFPDRFRTADGQQAPVLALRTCRRSGRDLLAASRRVARRLPAAPGASAAQARHRLLVPTPDSPPGEVRILVADSSTQEAALVADTLRRAHLADGVPWPSMAVLVRSATRQVPLLRRALTAANVPVAVAGDELPLAEEPGTRPLLMLLRCALNQTHLDDATAAELLCGPLGGTDALGLRRLRRSLQLLADADPEGQRAPDMLADALRNPKDLAVVPDRVAAPAQRLASLLATARDAIKKGGSAEDVLWAVWDASGLAAQWQLLSAAGGPAGAAADRDLDAVLALFDKAAHFTDSMPPGAPALFADSLSSQEIVGDTLAERAVREDCVPHPDRAPVQGPGMGRRGGGGRPGGDLARSADARLPAGRRRAGRSRGRPRPGRQRGRGRGHAGGQAAGRGAPAVLRGRHPREKTPRRHRGRRRGHGPKTVPVPDRAGRRRHPPRAGRREPAPVAVHARAGRRPAPGRRRHRAPAGRPAGRRGPAGPAGRGRGPRGPPARLVRADRAVRRLARSCPAARRSGCPRPRSSRSPGAGCAGCSRRRSAPGGRTSCATWAR